MTMCATSPNEPISIGARPELTHKLSDTARRAIYHLHEQLAEYGPPDCQINAADFTRIEITVSYVVKKRIDPATAYTAVDGKAVPIHEPLTKVLKWCQDCPVREACLAAMSELNYTGIAGGVILKKGEPYDYAKARPKRGNNADTESETSDGLW
ncbi:hypothetical protein BTO20_37515 (plasmid) [Mycobacterium dioxanotrophicus]|jgi:hypothetical protein|uniref:4Fe-4S Wbl-type domain-containing protein n=1 Tax=Mycobacterium dioxanotrophicus TaxID=482462 RepID=A0A1Y0CGZ1_9MYCO|nr:hypothetical protein [Mycobacterium dioxanotrophicus]ART74324.1 hypothetical protein BTO20_37515 [Mycobacterium dioxanotrophicus]